MMSRNKYDLHWHGTLTVDNIDNVVDLLKQLLDGKKYTFVSCYAYKGYKPEVRLHQEIEHKSSTTGNAFSIYRHDGWSSFNVCDTYGVWGQSTFNNPDFIFERDRVTIESVNGFNEKFYWTIVVEDQGD